MLSICSYSFEEELLQIYSIHQHTLHDYTQQCLDMLSLIEFDAEELRVDNGGKKICHIEEEKKLNLKSFLIESRDRKWKT